jgi:glycosyltransferase involved in cell wall biosynthesis
MKRFGANKDMVMLNFGRQIKLFESLSKLGHKVEFFCPDYKKHENKNIRKHGIEYYIRPYRISRHFKFLQDLRDLIKKNRYDYIVGSTDPLLGILGYWYAKKFNIKHIYDMQDEYSCYDSYKLPFVKHLDRKTIKKSDIVLTVSESLNRYVKRFRKKPTCTIQNGIDLSAFKKIENKKAIEILKLPQGKIIIYIGEISKFKGVYILIKAFQEIKKTVPDSYLLISGTVSDNINVNQDSIIYKKYPKREDIILALNAADVAVLPNKKNIFSQYCFPYKLVEYMAAGIPIVATEMGDSAIMLSKFRNFICKPNDWQDMAEKLIYALKNNKKVNYSSLLRNLTWKGLSKKLNKIIAKNGRIN